MDGFQHTFFKKFQEITEASRYFFAEKIAPFFAWDEKAILNNTSGVFHHPFYATKISPPFSIIATKKNGKKKRTTSFLSNMNRREQKKRSKLPDHAQLPLTFCFGQTNYLHSWIRVFWFVGCEVWRTNHQSCFVVVFFFWGGGGVDSTTTKLMATTEFFFLTWLEMVLSWQKPAKFLTCLGYFGENFLNLVLELWGSPPAWVKPNGWKITAKQSFGPTSSAEAWYLRRSCSTNKTRHFTPWLFNFQPQGQAPMFVT